MFVYFHADRFQFTMSKLNEEGEPQSIISWTTLVMKDQKDFNNKTFAEMFFHPTMSLLGGTTEPRISEEIKRIM